VGKREFSKMSKPLFEILSDGNNPVDLDAVDYKKYIHIRAVHIEKKFIDGKIVRTNSYHELHRCTSDNFAANDY
jgi:hypothetical protein